MMKISGFELVLMKISFEPEIAYAIELFPTVPLPRGVEVAEKEYVPPVAGEMISIPNPFGPELLPVPVTLPAPSKVAVPVWYWTPGMGASPPKKNSPEIDASLNGPPVCFSPNPDSTALSVPTIKAVLESIK